MKIVFITNQYPMLYNSFTVNEIIRLREKGIEVHVYSLHWVRLKTINENALRLGNDINYFVDALPGVNRYIGLKLLALSSKLKRRSDRLQKMFVYLLYGWLRSGVENEKFFPHLGLNTFTFERVAERISAEKFDMIHASFGNRPATAAMLLSELTGIPFTFELHAYDLFVDFPFAEEKIQKARKIFTISNYNKSYLKNRYNCPASKMGLIRVPINDAFCDRVCGQPRETDLLVSVCRLHPIKGLEYAVRALKILVEARPTIRLLLVGEGELEEELRALAGELGIERNVLFHGAAGNEEALRIVARASVFVLPAVVASNGDRDGIPTSLIEAMYLKTPVISSEVSGIPELIDDGLNGYLIQPGDAAELARKVAVLLGDEGLRIRMGELAREKITKEFYRRDCAEILSEGWCEGVDANGGALAHV